MTTKLQFDLHDFLMYLRHARGESPEGNMLAGFLFAEFDHLGYMRTLLFNDFSEAIQHARSRGQEWSLRPVPVQVLHADPHARAEEPDAGADPRRVTSTFGGGKGYLLSDEKHW
jgi:hypothetical protein